jgi:hypothetical protein
MGGDSIVVGNKANSRKPSPPVSANPVASSGSASPPTDEPPHPKQDRPAVCGAMSQQSGHNSIQSAPQKFVRLVGCHDPKARR